MARRLARLPALATWCRRSSVLPILHSTLDSFLYLLRAQPVGAYPTRNPLESRYLSVLNTARYAADGQCQCASGRHRVIHKIGPVRERTMIGCFLQAARPAYHTSRRLFSLHVMARDSGNSRTTCHGHFLLHTARKQHEWSSRREPPSDNLREELGRNCSQPSRLVRGPVDLLASTIENQSCSRGRFSFTIFFPGLLLSLGTPNFVSGTQPHARAVHSVYLFQTRPATISEQRRFDPMKRTLRTFGLLLNALIPSVDICPLRLPASPSLVFLVHCDRSWLILDRPIRPVRSSLARRYRTAAPFWGPPQKIPS